MWYVYCNVLVNGAVFGVLKGRIFIVLFVRRKMIFRMSMIKQAQSAVMLNPYWWILWWLGNLCGILKKNQE